MRLTTRARKALWRALHDQGAASRHELAELTRVPAAVAESELDAMCAGGLLVCERVGSRLLYRVKR
jgi:predicted transcriptional regulator